MNLAQAELAIVRIENAISADLVFQRQRLGFEFDAIFPGYMGPYIDGRSRLFVGMAKLEDDLGIAHREAVHIADAPPQDESVVIKTIIRRVGENDFPDLRPAAGLRVVHEPDFQTFRGALHQLAEVTKALNRSEAVRLQDQLGFQVLKLIERVTVGVSGNLCLSLGPVGRMYVGVGRNRDSSPSLMVAVFVLF